LNPTSAIGYFNRALVWRERGESARAIADCDQAIALEPSFADTSCKRGLTRAR